MKTGIASRPGLMAIRVEAAAVLLLILATAPLSRQTATAADTAFKDDPAAHELYSKMVASMRQATALSWVSDYTWAARGQTLGKATYKVWLQKPNFVRLEASRTGESEPAGILVGDGDYFWTYWPKEKPRYGWEYSGKYGEDYEKYRDRFYMKQRTPLGRHSISHEVGKLGAGMCMTILDPSTFHGYTDSLQPYIDGVRSLGMEDVGDVPCDVVEVSLMNHQRSWQLWLSKKDTLPRKLKEIVRVSHEITTEELWSEIMINADQSPTTGLPGPCRTGWKEWRMPEIEEGLLKPGTPAPDFELLSQQMAASSSSPISAGKIVWLNKWRCG